MEKTFTKFVWQYIKQFKWFIIFTMLSILLSSIASRVHLLYMAKIYGAVSNKTGENDYWNSIIIYILIAGSIGILRFIFNNISDYLSAISLPKIKRIITGDAFSFANKHSIAYFSEEMSGNISNKVEQLARNTVDLISTSLEVVSVFFAMIISFLFLFMVSANFVFPVLLWSSLMILIGRHFGKIRYQYAKQLGQIESSTNGKIVDSLANYSEIKSFANFKFERLNLGKNLKRLYIYERKERTIRAVALTTQGALVSVAIVLFLLYATHLLKIEKIDAVGFIYSSTLFSIISWSVFDVSGYTHRMSHIFGRLQAALDTLAIEPEILDKANSIKLDASNAKIDFKNVSFAYKGKENLFNNLNVQIKAGEKVGLVGCSGSGKSTFIKIIARYFDVSDGEIDINGINIKDISQDSLRKNISTIPQDVNLFNRTLFENIRYGATTASDEEVIMAAKKAFADDFIKKFPSGYQTKVGERGVILSGGERQRIAIARAILKNSPILIFDEATSALDSESEQHIQKSMKNLMKNKTVIAIAHRLSTLREMDRILVFENGAIVEEGTHLGLLRKKGIYYKLYNMQSDGLLGGIRDSANQKRTL